MNSKFAKGGFVSGAGNSKNDVIHLQKYEYVITKADVAHWFDNMEEIKKKPWISGENCVF